MKIRVLLFSLLCALPATPALRAADNAPAGNKAPAADEDDQTELGEHMEKIGGAFRRLGKQIADPAKNEESLKLVATIHTHALEAAKLQPAKTEHVPVDQRPKFLSDYNDQMKHFIADIEKLQAALKDGKNEAAVAIVKAMKADMDDAHKEFREKKKKA
jgi:cytochrome c556